jgi:hypothetical protein
MNAETAGHAGTPQLKQFHMGNIDMWKHPKYYKELRKLRNKSDQVISNAEATAASERAPGQGLTSDKLQAPSSKPQANLNQNLVQVLKHQATSCKATSTGLKLQAASYKLRDS